MNHKLITASLWISKWGLALFSALVFSYYLASFLFNDPNSSYSTYGEAFGIQFAFTFVAALVCLEKYKINQSKWVQSIFKIPAIVFACAVGAIAIIFMLIQKWGY